MRVQLTQNFYVFSCGIKNILKGKGFWGQDYNSLPEYIV